MADLHNPLFEDEKEFLEHQKLEYERALLGEVEEIKAKSQEIGKYVAIGAGVLSGIWLLRKAFGGKKKHELNGYDDHDNRARSRHYLQNAPRRYPYEVDSETADDLDFGAGRHQYDRGRTHTSSAFDSDPFQPYTAEAHEDTYLTPTEQQETPSGSLVQDFLQSNTGKMLVAQASAVLLAFAAKKAGEYFPMLKNPDLASSPSGTVSAEPETKDIEFTFHDDADAPSQPLRSSEQTPDARPEVTGHSA